MDDPDMTSTARTWMRHNGPISDLRVEELLKRADSLRISSALVGTVIVAAALLVGYDQWDIFPQNPLLVVLLATSCLIGLVVVLYGRRRAAATWELAYLLRMSRFQRRRADARSYSRGTSRPVQERFIGRSHHGGENERDHLG